MLKDKLAKVLIHLKIDDYARFVVGFLLELFFGRIFTKALSKS